MARSERNGADRTSTEARARFREAAGQLALRRRWLSIVAITADGAGTRVAAAVQAQHAGERHGDSSLPR